MTTENQKPRCPACGGTGLVPYPGRYVKTPVLCSTCKGSGDKPEAQSALSPVSLLGAVVEIKMIGYDGRWFVVREEGKKIWVQRPQDFKPKWVWRRYAKIIESQQAPNNRI